MTENQARVAQQAEASASSTEGSGFDSRFAHDIYNAVMTFDEERPRSKQSANFVVGMSELGFCSERTRRMLAGITPGPTDKLAAFFGTALGDYIEQAIVHKWPNVIRQADVAAVLHGDLRTYTVTGHPDLIFPDLGLMLDVKTDRGLADVERHGPSRQQQFQRHGYGLGAWEGGFFPEFALDEIRVGNVWFDRAADEKRCYVQTEKYNPEVVEEAAMWLDDVVYAYLQDEQARKEPPRQMCQVICGHFATCRALDTDVEGLIDDPETVHALALYQEGLALEREGAKLKDQAKPRLKGATGSTGEFTIRWVHVDETEVPASTRKGYDRLVISKIK